MSASVLTRRAEQLPPTRFRPDKAKIKIELKVDYLEHKQKSLTTYEAVFAGNYKIRNPYPRLADVSFIFPFPRTAGTISNIQLLVNDEEPPGVRYGSDGIHFSSRFGPNAVKDILVTYNAHGLNNYIYALPHDRRIEELNLQMVLSWSTRYRFSLNHPATYHQEEDRKRLGPILELQQAYHPV